MTVAIVNLLTWIASGWYVALPLGVAGALLARHRPIQRAAALGLVDERTQQLLRWSLASCAAFILLTFASIFYETNFWPPALAALSLVGCALLLRAARQGLHPGLHGFHWPLPSDGMALIERERILQRRPPLRWWVWRLAPIALPLTVTMLVAMWEGERWPMWLLAGVSLLAPLLLIATGHAWVSPLLLLAIPATVTWHSFLLRAALPDGHWVTPWRAAPCSIRSALAGDGTAWCFNDQTKTAYRYHLASGVVFTQQQVPEGITTFVAGQNGAWITQAHRVGHDPNPPDGLVYINGRRARIYGAFFPFNGVFTEQGELWFINRQARLLVYAIEADEEVPIEPSLQGIMPIVVRAAPDRSIWIGGMGGVRRFDQELGQWHSYGKKDGLQEPIFEIAAGGNGSVWFLEKPLRANDRNWWVSILQPDGNWQRINLRQLTGLDSLPHTLPIRNEMAVDGRGRLWLAAISYRSREKFLVVLEPDGTLAEEIISLGHYEQFTTPFQPFDPINGPITQLHAVFPDGTGGIYLYNGPDHPLRHWRP